MSITQAQQDFVGRILGGDNSGRVFKKGARGRTVRAIQLFLMGQGYDVGKGGADGIYGKDTLAAVAKYQKDAGINGNGRTIGARTFGAMRKGLDGASAIPKPRPEGIGLATQAEYDRMDNAAYPNPLQHPISKPVLPPTAMADATPPPTRDFSIADVPPIWDGANSPLAGSDVPPPPTALEPPAFGATTNPNVPDFGSPDMGMTPSTQPYVPGVPAGNPAGNADSHWAVEGLINALLKKQQQQPQMLPPPQSQQESELARALATGPGHPY